MASIKTTVRIEGLKELEKALHELPRATGGNVLKRAILKPAQAFADEASKIAPSPGAEGTGLLKRQIMPSRPKIITAGKAAFAAAMRSGASRSEAGEAARAANTAAGGAGRHAVVSVGPTRRAFYGQFLEFGTSRQAAKPFMRPTWDRMARPMLEMVKATLAEEIEKARARLAKKAEREARKKSGK